MNKVAKTGLVVQYGCWLYDGACIICDMGDGGGCDRDYCIFED